MAWIETVGDDEARGTIEEHFRKARERAGKVYNIVRIQSLKPRILDRSMALYIEVMRGRSDLSRAQREMIAVVVSKANACHY